MAKLRFGVGILVPVGLAMNASSAGAQVLGCVGEPGGRLRIVDSLDACRQNEVGILLGGTSLAGQACPEGQFVTGVDSSGDLVCASPGDNSDGGDDDDGGNGVAIPSLGGDLIITEIMPDPDVVADSAGEWFEIHNPTNVDFNLNGITFRDDGSDMFEVDRSLVIGSGEYITFARSAFAGFSADLIFSGMALGNTEDEIEILSTSGVVIDRVAWVGGFPFTTGASMSLDPSATDPDLNDDPANWCVAHPADQYFDGNLGTPGSGNPSC